MSGPRTSERDSRIKYKQARRGLSSPQTVFTLLPRVTAVLPPLLGNKLLDNKRLEKKPLLNFHELNILYSHMLALF